ncbi:DUF664 domain-containing protein, partial [Kibdelosporangium lantanae]
MSEPELTLHDPVELLAGYLDYYRDGVVRKFAGLADVDARRSFVPSGWTPLSLLKHLAYMERRWLRWGFAGEQVTNPWGDQHEDTGEWYVEPGETVDDVMALEGITGHPDDVVVTVGSQMALDMVTRIFCDPGDVVLAE